MPSDWRRVQSSIIWAQRWRQSVTSVALFDVPMYIRSVVSNKDSAFQIFSRRI